MAPKKVGVSDCGLDSSFRKGKHTVQLISDQASVWSMERPRRCKSKEELYSKVLRVKRKDILAELPDTAVILNDPRLEKIFTQFEKIESTSQKSSSDNADKLIQVVESKGYDAYKIFISVLKEYRPSLADKLTAALAAEELSRMNSGEDISRPCNS